MYYIKNTSETMAIVVNTSVGKVGIQPQEIAEIAYKLLPPISKSIKEVTQEEFLVFQEEKCGIKKQNKESKKKNIQQSKPMVLEQEKIETMEKIEDEVVNTHPLGIQDPEIETFVDTLINTEALKVTETDSLDEATQLEQQIEDLRESWKSTNSPRKKERISKEIKEIQKQLKKIKK